MDKYSHHIQKGEWDSLFIRETRLELATLVFKVKII